MLRYIFIFVLTVLMCACGGGGKKGSSSSGQGEIPTDTSKHYRLGGVVKGLSGNLVIANGSDTLTIGADGVFSFFQSISEGALYDVKILSLPANQLCELSNSKNYAYRDHIDVVVECANLVERKISLTLPSKVQLTDGLRLLSNYQAKGGVGEDVLDSLNTNLIVYNNSLVSLRNKSNQTIFLSYIGDINANNIEINSKTTAIALLMLEPAVILAIQDRGLQISDGVAQLNKPENFTDELKVLSAEVEKLINSGGNLNNPSKTLIAALSQALKSTVNSLFSASPLPTLSSDKALSEALGVVFKFDKINDKAVTLNLSATSQVARYLSLRSDRFTSTLLKPFESAKDLGLNPSTSSQQNFTVTIAGPGVLGNISDANVANALDASINSGVNQFFLPSISVLLGLNSPASFNSADCLSAKTITALGAQAATIATVKDEMKNDQYYKLFSDIAVVARNQFVTVTKDSTQAPIDDIFSCEKLGLGVLIGSKKSIAIENTKGILNALNAVYSSANIQLLPDLFSNKNLNQLFEVVKTSYTEKEWNLSDSLQFDIAANLHRIAVGNSISFSSTCKDPSISQAVGCDVVWDFGDGGTTATGASVSRAFTTIGHYVVKGTATSIYGAKQTQTIQIDVLPFAPNVNVQLGATSIAANSIAYNFGNLDVGLKSTLTLTVFNDGFDNLNISSITSSDSNFKVDMTATANQLIPGAVTKFNITFEPTTASVHSSTIHILTNDPDQSDFSFNIAGSAYGHWTIKNASSEKTFIAVRSNHLYDNTDGKENLQIRLFASLDQDYPQIRLSLKGYDLSSTTKGDGKYSLDDDVSGEICLGFFSDAADASHQYCTSTASGVTPASGFVSISSALSNLSEKKATFEFDVLNRPCIGTTSSCDVTHILGEVRYQQQ